mmetsp:Transcript_11543/g.35677  ORF Transcript_11543/g.35677 Transcript_11543/m.35677 type:complete len:86 (-) Transcript_11543:214-471(-)|eukprot:scaffold245520_cov28-Tisochrysis_lutea.AAC.2
MSHMDKGMQSTINSNETHMMVREARRCSLLFLTVGRWRGLNQAAREPDHTSHPIPFLKRRGVGGVGAVELGLTLLGNTCESIADT